MVVLLVQELWQALTSVSQDTSAWVRYCCFFLVIQSHKVINISIRTNWRENIKQKRRKRQPSKSKINGSLQVVTLTSISQIKKFDLTEFFFRDHKALYEHQSDLKPVSKKSRKGENGRKITSLIAASISFRQSDNRS